MLWVRTRSDGEVWMASHDRMINSVYPPLSNPPPPPSKKNSTWLCLSFVACLNDGVNAHVRTMQVCHNSLSRVKYRRLLIFCEEIHGNGPSSWQIDRRGPSLMQGALNISDLPDPLISRCTHAEAGYHPPVLVDPWTTSGGTQPTKDWRPRLVCVQPVQHSRGRPWWSAACVCARGTGRYST